jgi:hypothetical protein
MDVQRNADGRLALLRHNLQNVQGGEQIFAFVQELIAERDDLSKRQDHLNSLARLMEKTVADADDLAAQIRREAEERAQARIKELTEEAELQAQLVIEETKSKAVAEAENEVRSLRSGAQRELDALIDEQTAALRAQAKEMSERLYQAILNEAEESNRRITAIQADMEAKLATLHHPAGDTPAATASQGSASPKAAEATEAPARKPTPEKRAPQSSAPAEPDKADVVEIEILPPRDKGVIEGIRTYLGLQDEVGAAEIRHLTDKTLIEVQLLRPMDVLERVSRLPEVEEARAVADGAQMRIEVVLSVRSEIERARGGLNFKANRIASRIGGLSR